MKISNTNIKVGVLIDRIIFGGVEKIAIQEVRAFRQLGINAVLLVISRKTFEKGAFSDLLKGIPIIYLDDRIPKFLKFSFKFPFFYYFSLFHITYPIFLPFYIKKNEFDIILSHNTYTSFTAFTLAKTQGIPYVMYVYDPISYILKKAYPKGVIKMLSAFLLKIACIVDSQLVNNAKAVLTTSIVHSEFLNKILKNNKKVLVVTPGRDYSAYIPPRRGETIISVTAWKEGKGLEDFLPLIAKNINYKLKIIGKWVHRDYLRRIKQQIKQLHIEKRVEIVGQVLEQQLNAYYLKARMVIILNEEQGYGLPALEGGACGCPFIIPRKCGVAKFFKNNEDGFFYDYKDFTHLEMYINRLLTDEKKAYEMGKHAWETIKKKYSWERHAKLLLRVMTN